MTWRVPLADLDYGSKEENAVMDVIQSRWLTMGGVTQKFEDEFAAFLGAKYAVAFSNATVALHLACLTLDIGPGDEVVAPSLTFVATTNAVLYTGAQVRFADILGPRELTISPDEIEKQITPRTKAIMLMHYGGYPCRLVEILSIAEKHGLAVIEDAAHAPGASLHGRSLGTWGDAGCFSFFSNKNLSTGEGGMLVTNSEDIAERARLLRSHGMTTLTWDRHQGHSYSYDVVDLGYNYRIDEIRSALGLVQLSKLEKNNQRRKAITECYWDAFSNTPLELPFRDSSGEPAYHIFPVLLPQGVDRKAFIDELRGAGIQTSIHYPPIHQFSHYRKLFPDVSLPQTEDIAAREVTLPLYPSMTDEDVDFVVSAVKQTIVELAGQVM
ncbi:MAG: DegT/DnrJ/EryC1/StrS family aminotransferase [Anaerolineales bacterium]|nr:DegT/DnrJ/EryC1/StrS family aminotransferase [Chloroflexota bacterium]MBL6982303.1 DegT/DnrJ/EryC1/StrS family aminotransferase [Anaerolineales bacterium]